MHDEDIYHVMFIYDDHVMIYPEAEQHAILDELLNYTNKYSLNKKSYDKIANSITTIFYEKYYHNRITRPKPIDSSEVVYKKLTILNQSDEKFVIYYLYPLNDEVYYVNVGDYVNPGKSKNLGFSKYKLENIFKKDSSMTIIVVSKENAYKYEKETEKTPEDWIKNNDSIKEIHFNCRRIRFT